MSTAEEIVDKLDINIKSVSDTDKIPDALDAKMEAIKNRKRDKI